MMELFKKIPYKVYFRESYDEEGAGLEMMIPEKATKKERRILRKAARKLKIPYMIKDHEK